MRTSPAPAMRDRVALYRCSSSVMPVLPEDEPGSSNANTHTAISSSHTPPFMPLTASSHFFIFSLIKIVPIPKEPFK